MPPPSRPPLPFPFLYAISDLASPDDVPRFVDRMSAMARAGLSAVQVRQKGWDDLDLLGFARALRAALPSSTLVLTNRRFDIARAAGADGVHLPSDGLSPARVRPLVPASFRILVSTHTPAEVTAAADAGADAVTFGPVWATPSKAGLGPPCGIDRFADVASAAPLPVIPLGGIDSPERVVALSRIGAAGFAAIRLFTTPTAAPLDEPAALVHSLRSTFGVGGLE